MTIFWQEQLLSDVKMNGHHCHSLEEVKLKRIHSALSVSRLQKLVLREVQLGPEIHSK